MIGEAMSTEEKRQHGQHSPLSSPPERKARRLLSDAFSLLCSLLPISLGMLIYVWPHVQMVRLAYQFQALQQQTKTLQQENRRLQIEVATLRSPQRIARIAQELGLVVPQNDQLVVIKRQREPDASRSTP
ncbi:MAG: cell division protein FtsL [Nitrospinota bacterium]|nr:MAG: cell division protein FtsL [Nitrospinota bacterium]